jgi:membrane protease YdiL (CAAX protease family)
LTQPPGPPGSRLFSLEDRPAPALYLIGWLASGSGLALLVVALASSSSFSPILALGAVVLLGIGLAFAAGHQVVARRTRPAQAYRGPSPLILFGLVFTLSTIASLGLGLAGVDPTEPAGFLVSLAVIGSSYLLVVWAFVVRTGAMRWSEMGWPIWRSRPGQPWGPPRPVVAQAVRDVGFALAFMVPVTFAAVLGGGLLALLLDVQPPPVVPEAENALDIAFVAVAAALVAPIGEELFFRGFALTAWWRDLGPRSALIRSAVFFAIIHIANVQATTFVDGLKQAIVQVAVILPIGLVIGVLFQQRGMIASIGAHLGYNGLLLALFFLSRDLAPT